MRGQSVSGLIRHEGSRFAAQAIAWIAALLTPAALSFLSLQTVPSILLYVGILITGSGVVVLALQSSKRLSWQSVLLVAVAAHGLALLGTPAFEDDHFRFVWDGWRTLQTGSPYGAAPEQFFTSAEVPPGYAGVLSEINHPEHPTIYGPVLQIAFAAGAAMTGPDSIGVRVLFALGNLGVIALLLQSRPPVQVALYAWSPFVVSEVALHAHPDGIMAVFVLAALALHRRHPLLAGVCLGFAAGSKIIALAAWPILLRSGWRSVVAAPLTLLALYAPFLVQGFGAGFESTGTFASEWLFNPIGFGLISAVLPDPIARITAAFTGITLILFLHASSKSAEDTPLAAIFAVAVLFSPAVNPWYLLWVLPFATGRTGAWPWLLSLALPFAYITGLNLDSRTLAPFEVHPAAYGLQIALIFCGFALALRQSAWSAPR